MKAWESSIDVGKIVESLQMEAKVTPALKWLLSHPERKREAILGEIFKGRFSLAMCLRKIYLEEAAAAIIDVLESKAAEKFASTRSIQYACSMIKSVIKAINATEVLEVKSGIPLLTSLLDSLRAEGAIFDALLGATFKEILEEPGGLYAAIDAAFQGYLGMKEEQLRDALAEIYERYSAGVSDADEDGMVRAHKLMHDYVTGLSEVKVLCGTVLLRMNFNNLDTKPFVPSKNDKWEKPED